MLIHLYSWSKVAFTDNQTSTENTQTANTAEIMWEVLLIIFYQFVKQKLVLSECLSENLVVIHVSFLHLAIKSQWIALNTTTGAQVLTWLHVTRLYFNVLYIFTPLNLAISCWFCIHMYSNFIIFFAWAKAIAVYNSQFVSMFYILTHSKNSLFSGIFWREYILLLLKILFQE